VKVLKSDKTPRFCCFTLKMLSAPNCDPENNDEDEASKPSTRSSKELYMYLSL